MSDQQAYMILKEHRHEISRQEIKTLYGQIRSGNAEAAIRGLATLLERREKNAKKANLTRAGQ